MTLDLNAIKARVEAATPGPWEWWVGNPWHATAPNHPLRDGNAPTVFTTGDSGNGFFYREDVQAQAKLDTTFIAAAREDVPALLQEIERLTAERDHLAQYHGGHLPTCGGMDSVERRCDCGYLQGEAYRDLYDNLAKITADHAALRTVVADMAIPYEAIRMDEGSRKWIAPEVWAHIVAATERARAALGGGNG